MQRLYSVYSCDDSDVDDDDDADGDDDDDVDCDGRRGHSEAFIPLALPAIAAWSSGQAATTAGNIIVTMTVIMVMVKMII